jgi:hypothetical protein
MRIAMWSGPRNISTAMMRSWGNRPDTLVCDEPFYAYYLRATGAAHPGAAQIIRQGETDWRKVVTTLTGDSPPGKSIFYQKQMAHHLLPEIDRSWLAEVTNCLLIRDPAEVITSYIRKNYDPTPHDLGFPQQAEIFGWLRSHREVTPPVIDARDVLQQPRKALGLLCDALGVPFDPSMLAWPPGPRDTDGVWAPYWYAEVFNSTGFQPYRPKLDPVPSHLTAVFEECLDLYHHLFAHRLR